MATVYISPTGNDTTGDGTEGTPWLTITKAVAETTVGDTIIALAGTYDLTTTGNLNGLRTLQGATGDPNDVIFDAGGANMEWIISNGTSVSGACTVKHITITGIYSTTSGDANIIAGSGNSTDLMTIENCIIHDMEVTGSAAASGLIDIGTFISGAASNTLILNTLIYDIRKATSASIGVMFYALNNVADTTTVRIVNSTISLDATGSSTLTHIVRYGNFSQTDTYSHIFTNSIVENVGNTVIEFALNAGNVTTTISYSCLYAPTAAFTGTYTTGDGMVTTNPLFVDRTTANYNLRPGSPCLFTGTAV